MNQRQMGFGAGNESRKTVRKGGAMIVGEEDVTFSLDIFTGPLDLLLYLIKQHEIDVYDIPISDITTQYLEMLDVMESMDISYAGDFLVMAATLMEIKSRQMLPSDEEEGESDDPRLELVRQLLDYKKYKDRAVQLDTMRERAALFERRGYDEIPAKKVEGKFLHEITVWDLFSAFRDVTKDILAEESYTIKYDDKPIKHYMEQIEKRLHAEGKVPFNSLFRGGIDRIQVISLFLALLELTRLETIIVEQRTTGEIILRLREAA
ncbi:MAG: segregation/condensation protein A [Planctomycetes bacterium]|nr:segregation/condensation protein A [Planctomycetota bacterium]